METISLTDIFTNKELESFKNKKAKDLKLLIAPLMTRINLATGQENDLKYWCYLLEYFFNQK